MSQYSTGTATVTNGSATVTGTNTLWLANVTAGDSFTVAGDGVMYDVASVDSDTQVTLSVAYAGATASGVVYAIGTGFTVPDSFPEMSQGDIETATIFTRAMRKIQSRFTGIAINTTAEIGQAVSDHVALPDPHSQYAELSGGASANFTTMPQVGGDPIVESGSNADGEWTRWSDGTQICTSIVRLFVTPVSNTVAFSSRSLPQTFVGVSEYSGWSIEESNIGSGGVSSAGEIYRNGLTMKASSTAFDISAYTYTEAIQNDCYISVIAIGRWK
jgi:hypothetical protein